MRRGIIYSLLGGISRLLSGLVKRWPFILIGGLMISPVGPHIRWTYEYIQTPAGRHYVSCTYFGSRGLIAPPNLPPECPGIVILDARKWGR